MTWTRISERFEDLRNLQAETSIEKLTPVLQEQLATLVSNIANKECLSTQIRDLEGIIETLKQRNDYLEKADLQLRDERDALKSAESSHTKRINDLQAEICRLHGSQDAAAEETKLQESNMSETISRLQTELSQLRTQLESVRQKKSSTIEELRAQLVDSEACRLLLCLFPFR